MAFTPNLLVKADALELMERLQDQSIDLVYLDPPWIAIDDSSRESKDSFRNFLYKILQQAQRVLKKSGNIFMYSRPDLNLDFGGLLSEVFGSDNYVCEIVIPMNRNLSSTHETLFHFRASEVHVFNKVYRNSQEEIIRFFPNADAKGHFIYHSLFAPMKSASFNFEWHGVTPPDGYGWRFAKEKLNEMHIAGLIEMRQDRIYLKKYFTSVDQLRPVGTLWDDIVPLVTKKKVKGEQNVKLLERIINIGSNKGQIVLDPFCGSGSCIEACLNLERLFIACDNNEEMIEICRKRLHEKYNFIVEEDLITTPLVWDKYTYEKEEDEIEDIIVKGENAFLEFKESICWNYNTLKKENGLSENVLRALASFLNTAGGTLLIGVKNDGSLRDLQLDFEAVDPQKRNKDGYELFLNNKIKDLLGIEAVHKCRIAFFTIKKNQICRIEVEQCKDPVILKNEFFVRMNNQTIKLSMIEFYGYMNRRSQ